MNVERKKTQGETKMERYIDDLVRNEEFIRDMKLLRKYNEGIQNTDIDIKEITDIIDGYEKLRKRCNKIFKDKFMKKRAEISENYKLDSDELFYAEALLNPRYKDSASHMKLIAEPDMCKLWDLYDDEMNPENKGDEIIYLNPSRQLFFNAYPLAICIHSRASKRDILDFIEKRWKWIENGSHFYSEHRKLKYGKRKYEQGFLDYIWEFRNLPNKKLMDKLDKQFPGNSLVYNELQKLIQLEANRRFGSLS